MKKNKKQHQHSFVHFARLCCHSAAAATPTCQPFCRITSPAHLPDSPVPHSLISCWHLCMVKLFQVKPLSFCLSFLPTKPCCSHDFPFIVSKYNLFPTCQFQLSVHRPHSAGLAHCLSKHQCLCLHCLCNNCCPGPEIEKQTTNETGKWTRNSNYYNREHKREAFGPVRCYVFEWTGLSYKISVAFMFLWFGNLQVGTLKLWGWGREKWTMCWAKITNYRGRED